MGGKTELTGPFVYKSDEERIVHGAILVPGELDSDGEAVTAEKIREVAHNWMLEYRNIDVQHKLNNVAVPVESFILPYDYEVELPSGKAKIPAGSWVLGAKVQDDATWKAVKLGKLTGFSVMGIRKVDLNTSLKSQSDVSLKKTLLRDLGEDWIAVAVSIVDEPAVPKAKFFSIKNEAKDDTSFIENLKKLFHGDSTGKNLDKDSAEKVGRRISNQTYTHLKNAYSAIEKLIEEAEKEREETNKSKKGDVDVDKEQVLELIKETLQESNLLPADKDKGTDEDEKNKETDNVSTEDLVARIEALESSLKESDEKDSDEKDEKDEKSGKSSDEKLRQDIAEKLKELEAKIDKKSTKSRGILGQDDGKDDSAKKGEAGLNRDIYGRKRKGNK